MGNGPKMRFVLSLRDSRGGATGTTLSDMKKISVVTEGLVTIKTSYLRAFATIDRSHICPESYQEQVKYDKRSRKLKQIYSGKDPKILKWTVVF